MSQTTSANYVLLLKGLLAVLVGFYFVYAPESALKDVGFVLGTALIVLGVVWGYGTWKRYRSETLPSERPFVPLATILSGILMIYFLDEIITFIFILIGAWILVLGIFQISTSPGFNRRRMYMSRGVLFLGIFLVLIGILVLMNPKKMVDLMVTLLGISMMLAGGLFLVLALDVKESHGRE